MPAASPEKDGFMPLSALTRPPATVVSSNRPPREPNDTRRTPAPPQGHASNKQVGTDTHKA
jgi:hypothetical protein